jgi:hypothetical protein
MIFDVIFAVLFGWFEYRIPIRVKRRLCIFGFTLGAVLAGVGWIREQDRKNCTSCYTDMYSGFVEAMMILLGVMLMFLSIWVWPWFEEHNEK